MKKLSLLFAVLILGMGTVVAQNLIANGNFTQVETRNIVNRDGYPQTMEMPTGWNVVKLIDDESGYDAGVTMWGDKILVKNTWDLWEFAGKNTAYSRFFYQEVAAPAEGVVTLSIDFKGGGFSGEGNPKITLECRAGEPLPEEPEYILLSQPVDMSTITTSALTTHKAVFTLPAAYTYYVGFSLTNVNSGLWMQVANVSLSYGAAGVDKIGNDVPLAFVEGNTIRVDGCKNCMIYTMTGTLIDSAEENQAFTSKPLPQGMYIVNMDGHSQKVVIGE